VTKAAWLSAMFLVVAPAYGVHGEPNAFSEGAIGEAYRQGVSDWLGGLCYRARPYLSGPPEKEAAWERGWHDAKRRVPKPVERDDSVCFPGRGNGGKVKL
jgi:hypothetical protein